MRLCEKNILSTNLQKMAAKIAKLKHDAVVNDFATPKILVTIHGGLAEDSETKGIRHATTGFVH